tara:strand:+ start:2064 stop:2288 length:225 start_codon:yes stop_codon:yes gene_type:complete
MKIIQQPDGSADFIFDEREIEIMNKTKKLNLHGTAFKGVVNSMVHVMMQWNMNLDEAVRNSKTSKNEEEFKETK